MSVKVAWSRLIRFVGADGNIYFGDAITADADFDVGVPANLPFLTAKIVTGDPLSPNCVVTGQVMKVKQLLGPLTNSMVPAVRCIGGNYAAHLKEIGIEPKCNPDMFMKAPYSISGYGDEVEIPKIAQDDQADYEGELAIVIGRDAKNVSEEDALNYVLGYTVADDVSARKWMMDPQLVGTFPPPQMSFGKSFDMFAPVGPCLVSTQVITDPHTMSIRTKVNGALRQDSNTSDLIHNIPRIIQFCSQGTTLQAGSIILTGSPAGVGYFMKPPVFLRPGDTVEITVGKIGTLVHGIKFS